MTKWQLANILFRREQTQDHAIKTIDGKIVRIMVNGITRENGKGDIYCITGYSYGAPIEICVKVID